MLRFAAGRIREVKSMAEKLKYFVNGQFRESKTDKWYDLHNPSTGEITGQAPCCTNDEVLEAIAAAKAAYPGWSATPAIKRAQILYRVRELILERMDELTMSVAKENGKVWAESEGDVLKAIANAEKKIVEIRQQRKKFENEAEFYKKKTLPHEVQKGLADADSDINSQEVFIAEKKKELEVIRAKYDEDKRRFVELISQRPPKR